jgi:hypothetical protein
MQNARVVGLASLAWRFTEPDGHISTTTAFAVKHREQPGRFGRCRPGHCVSMPRLRRGPDRGRRPPWPRNVGAGPTTVESPGLRCL